MNLPLEGRIGLRYLRAKRHNRFISFISLISMLGIALAVVLLITVLSVMNGFQRELRERILVLTPHLTVSGPHERLPDWQPLLERLRAHPQVTAAAPFVRGEAMFTQSNLNHAGLIRGVDPRLEAQVSEIGDKIKAGSLDSLQAGAFNIILGKELALALGVWVDDKVTIITPEINVSGAGVLPRLKRFTVSGIFEVGMYEYDRGMALTHLADAAALFRLEGAVSGISAQTHDAFAAPLLRRALADALHGDYRVVDWTRRHANFFKAVQMEKTVMFIILSLIAAVAAFNIVSTLVMVVTDKAADIAILRTLGLSPGGVMTVFMVQGTVIGALGTLAGLAGGVTLALNLQGVVRWIEETFGTRFLDPGIYYISEVPSQLLWSDVGVICAVAFGLSVLATLYPAWTASRTQPAQALRYE